YSAILKASLENWVLRLMRPSCVAAMKPPVTSTPTRTSATIAVGRAKPSRLESRICTLRLPLCRSRRSIAPQIDLKRERVGILAARGPCPVAHPLDHDLDAGDLLPRRG